ncbi:MAG: hypothetical protein IKX51_05255 [Bacteroidales bacterium]|nr:hypothetical protein [Bacteroidales bacterium]
MKKPLYRKVNKITHNGIRYYCQETDRYRNERNKKNKSLPNQLPIKRKQNRHDNDYAPLYRFLLSRVGCNWDEVWNECISRLDKVEPVLDMVVNVNKKGLAVDTSIRYPEGLPEMFHDFRACDDSQTFWSTLYVDSNGILQYVDEHYTIDDADWQDDLYGILTASWNGKPIYPKGFGDKGLDG